jgi:cytochrome P450
MTDSIAVAEPVDIYAEWAQMRAVAPVHTTSSPFSRSAASVYDFANCSSVLRDPGLFSSKIVGRALRVSVGSASLIGSDNPEHRRYRALVSGAFRAPSLQRWVDTIMVPAVDRLIDGFVGDGRAELMTQLMRTFPVEVIAGILGLPPEHNAQFAAWSTTIMRAYEDRRAARQARAELRAELDEIIQLRRTDPSDDVISDLVASQVDGETLSNDEIYSFVALLLAAGVETTYRFSGTLVWVLLSHPQQLEVVMADRSRVASAVEECLRWQAPFPTTIRTTTADTELGGVGLESGTLVNVVIGSANRDPARHSDPDTFDLNRADTTHLSFGVGPHMCLGMHLARLESEVVLSRLVDRLDNLRLDGRLGSPAMCGDALRGPDTLRVVFDRGHRT